jgi:isopenicillin-N N-acyltransferase-like protein
VVRCHTSPPAAPADRGRAFGAEHALSIEGTLDFYSRRLAVLAGGPVDLLTSGARVLNAIAAWAPELAAEIEGIAAGAGLPVEHVAALNARTELLAGLGGAGAGECSVVVSPAVAAQTWDWHEELADRWLVWTIRHPGGRVVHTLTEYGIVGKIGVSSRGVGVLLNLLTHAADGGLDGIPVHVLARRVLDTAQDVDQALDLVTSTPVSASSALTLVDAAGRALTAELHPGGAGVVEPQASGVLLHTNHFLLPDAARGDLEIRGETTSLDRLAALRDTGPESEDGVVAAMSKPPVLCRPRPSDPPGERYATLATVTLDVPGGAMRVRAGAAQWSSLADVSA